MKININNTTILIESENHLLIVTFDGNRDEVLHEIANLLRNETIDIHNVLKVAHNPYVESIEYVKK